MPATMRTGAAITEGGVGMRAPRVFACCLVLLGLAGSLGGVGESPVTAEVPSGPVSGRPAVFVPEHLSASRATSHLLAVQGSLATSAACATLYADGRDPARAGCTHGVDAFVFGHSGTAGLNPLNFPIATPP